LSTKRRRLTKKNSISTSTCPSESTIDIANNPDSYIDLSTETLPTSPAGSSARSNRNRNRNRNRAVKKKKIIVHSDSE
jgi:hypothetical protein